VAVAALQSAGYRVATRVLAGASLLAQARSRLFLVGARRDEHTAFAWPELPNLNLLFQGNQWKFLVSIVFLFLVDIRDSNDNDGPRLSEQQRAAMIKIKEIKPEKKVCFGQQNFLTY
jgi:site-specific DNA-cytosine methylase